MALLSKQQSFFVIRFHKCKKSTLSLDPYEDEIRQDPLESRCWWCGGVEPAGGWWKSSHSVPGCHEDYDGDRKEVGCRIITGVKDKLL